VKNFDIGWLTVIIIIIIWYAQGSKK